jgi:RHS repeat-associated protein
MMAPYVTKNTEFTWESSAIYGSSRLGVVETNVLLVDNGNTVTSSLPTDEAVYFRGKKRYELSNHLGNVLAVVSDKRTQICVGGYQHYEAEIIVAQDYYPFGMIMPERTFSATTKGYRFAFQGQEGDDEVSGEGNSYAYKYRMHDPRLGRFLSIDPLSSKYPQWSPYQFSGNQVISTIELEGAEPLKDANEYGKALESKKSSSLNQEVSTVENFEDQNTWESYKNRSTEWSVYDDDGEILDGAITGGFTLLKAEAYDYSGRNVVNFGYKSTVMEARIGVHKKFGPLGGFDVNASGGLGQVEASTESGWFNGEGGDYGLKINGELGLYGVKGEYTPSLNILNAVTLSGTVGASAATANIGGGLNLFYNDSTEDITISGMQHVGLIVGEKGGWEAVIHTKTLKRWFNY